MWGVRVTPRLEVLDTLFIGNTQWGQSIPCVAFNGSDHIVVYVDEHPTKGIVASRVSPQGTVMDTGYTVDADGNYPDAASGGGNALIVWSREYSGVWARFVDGQAVPLDTAFRIASILASSADPAVVWGGGAFLAVWPDFNGPGGDLDIYGQAVSASGQLIGERTVVASGPEAQMDPAVSFDGTVFNVVWQEGSDRICGRDVGLDGKPVGGPYIMSDTAYFLRQRPAVAAGSDFRCCIWSEYHGDYDIYGAIDDQIGIADARTGTGTVMKAAPNPFRRATHISAGIRTEGLGLRIYDISGRLMKNMVFNSSLIPNSQFLLWDGTDENGSSVPGGVYFARLSGERASRALKIIKIE